MRVFGTRLTGALAALFNVLALNLVLIIASLPVVTVPVAAAAASAALGAWGRAGEDRVVRQFLIEFRRLWSARTMLGAGVQLLAAILGVAEIRYFAGRPTLAGFAGAGLCLGGGALLVTAGALGYVLRLLGDEPGPCARMRLVDLWSLSARLAAKNLLTVGIPAAVPAAGVAVLAARDPAVLLLGLPVFQLYALRRMTGPGLRRAAADGLLPQDGDSLLPQTGESALPQADDSLLPRAGVGSGPRQQGRGVSWR